MFKSHPRHLFDSVIVYSLYPVANDVGLFPEVGDIGAQEICYSRMLLLTMRTMTDQVLVTRRGQTTIPARIRKKLGIREGTILEVELMGNKVVFSKAPSLNDLDGKSKLSRQEAFRLLDEMRLQEA